MTRKRKLDRHPGALARPSHPVEEECWEAIPSRTCKHSKHSAGAGAGSLTTHSCQMNLGTPSRFLSLLIVIFRNLPAAAPRLILSVCTGLQLLDMPEQVLKHISRSISARRWAIGPARTCCTLNRLSLPVIKVRSVNIHMMENG